MVTKELTAKQREEIYKKMSPEQKKEMFNTMYRASKEFYIVAKQKLKQTILEMKKELSTSENPKTDKKMQDIIISYHNELLRLHRCLIVVLKKQRDEATKQIKKKTKVK